MAPNWRRSASAMTVGTFCKRFFFFCRNVGFGTNPALNEMHLRGHRQPFVHAAPSLSELKWCEAAAARATLWSWRNEPFHLFPLTRRRWFHPQLETLRPCCPVNTSAPHSSCRNKKRSISRHIQSATLRSSADIHFFPPPGLWSFGQKKPPKNTTILQPQFAVVLLSCYKLDAAVRAGTGAWLSSLSTAFIAS